MYVSSSHSLLFSDSRFDAGLGATSPSFLKGDYRATARFLDLSINAPNWDVLYAARVARNI